MATNVENSEASEKELSNKNRNIDLLLCVFLGFFGVHRFYEGKTKSGILYLCTCGVFGLGWLVDIVLILCGKATDSEKKVLSGGTQPKKGCLGCLGFSLLALIVCFIVFSFNQDKIEKGIAYYEKGNFEKAEDILTSVDLSGVSAKEVIGNYYLSNIYKQNGDEEKQIKHLLNAYNALIDDDNLQKRVNEYKGDIANKILNEPFEAYEQGNYSVAKGIWADNSKILEPKNAQSLVVYYYLSEIYKQEGNEQDFLNCRITVYNSLVNNTDLCNEVDKYKADISSTVLNDPSIAALKKKQAFIAAAGKYIGTYNLISCQREGKRYPIENLRNYTKKIVLNDNGTVTLIGEMEKNSTATWDIENGKPVFSSGKGLNIGYNSQGYIVLSCAVITNRMNIIWVSLFFGK